MGIYDPYNTEDINGLANVVSRSAGQFAKQALEPVSVASTPTAPEAAIPTRETTIRETNLPDWSKNTFAYNTPGEGAQVASDAKTFNLSNTKYPWETNPERYAIPTQDTNAAQYYGEGLGNGIPVYTPPVVQKPGVLSYDAVRGNSPAVTYTYGTPFYQSSSDPSQGMAIDLSAKTPAWDLGIATERPVTGSEATPAPGEGVLGTKPFYALPPSDATVSDVNWTKLKEDYAPVPYALTDAGRPAERTPTDMANMTKTWLSQAIPEWMPKGSSTLPQSGNYSSPVIGWKFTGAGLKGLDRWAASKMGPGSLDNPTAGWEPVHLGNKGEGYGTHHVPGLSEGISRSLGQLSGDAARWSGEADANKRVYMDAQGRVYAAQLDAVTGMKKVKRVAEADLEKRRLENIAEHHKYGLMWGGGGKDSPQNRLLAHIGKLRQTGMYNDDVHVYTTAMRDMKTAHADWGKQIQHALPPPPTSSTQTSIMFHNGNEYPVRARPEGKSFIWERY